MTKIRYYWKKKKHKAIEHRLDSPEIDFVPYKNLLEDKMTSPRRNYSLIRAGITGKKFKGNKIHLDPSFIVYNKITPRYIKKHPFPNAQYIRSVNFKPRMIS